MVAYNFQKRFIEPIQLGIRDPFADGAKLQTIRAHRKRHVRPDEMLQLYSGMRTKSCAKIVPDQLCEDVFNIRFEVSRSNIEDMAFGLTEPCFDVLDIDAFAKADGFADANEMSAFWYTYHGDGLFEGVLIKWFPEAYLDERASRNLRS